MKLRELIEERRINLDSELVIVDQDGNEYEPKYHNMWESSLYLEIDTTPTEDHKAKGKG